MAKQTISEQIQKLLFMLYKNYEIFVYLWTYKYSYLTLSFSLLNYMDVRYGDLVTIMFFEKNTTTIL